MVVGDVARAVWRAAFAKTAISEGTVADALSAKDETADSAKTTTSVDLAMSRRLDLLERTIVLTDRGLQDSDELHRAFARHEQLADRLDGDAL